MAERPLIAIPARFSAGATALRYAGVVAARAVVEAVWRGGGEPYVMYPGAPREAAALLRRCDGLLLPGGGDVAPHRYGAAEAHSRVYDVDDAQDAFDLAAAGHALSAGLPTLAICRGLQVVNVAAGGTLRQHLEPDHMAFAHRIAAAPGSLLAKETADEALSVSCFHHQAVEDLGTGLSVTARADDGTVEAVEFSDASAWFLAVQWHPEDTAETDAAQQGLFAALVRAARGES
ncbi:putative glutamine amidotransferase [Actinocorallia herbida]|uniref:Putative glutamine amidotransferase n=1 Tax=Actinocorallia herbida TaxID=58109 RepID=A0A3N1D3X5_9ACTN|nr:gamma-glutamyl-gamma-aminobutyrate hydrolase family protein [Actinocorallia herbida]ROO88227.1 putative glutamine amidotransferase [Actinocorallia herbida]